MNKFAPIPFPRKKIHSLIYGIQIERTHKGVILRFTKKLICIKICFFSLWGMHSYAVSNLENAPLLTDSFLLSLDNKVEQKTVLKYGKLEGQIFVPEGVDPSSVIVQVAGVKQFNQTSEDFYTSPDKQGHFIFNNTFTVGSSLNLIFWDKQGQLNKRSLPVYVSKFASFYNVFLEKSSVTSELAFSFGENQDVTRAGLCGKITGLTPDETLGSEVYLQDTKAQSIYSAKYFDENYLPNLHQNYLSKNGNFCFFNVESLDNSFFYSLKLKFNNGDFKSFFVYLPSYTFASNVEFDAKSALFRPVQFYSWDNSSSQFYKLNNNNDLINWHSEYDVYFSTSYDFSSINFNKHSQNNAVYFPLGDEFLNINYSYLDENDHHFFVFQPRSALFNKKLLSAVQDFSPGQSYVDYTDPVVVKTFDPKTMKGKNLNNLIPLYNENFGSLFLNLDTSDFLFDKKYIKVYLKDISGQDISYFTTIDSPTAEKEISGFFYNLPAGLYQLFVTVPTAVSNCDNCTTFNTTEKLLWSSLVESLPNTTQVLTNISDNKVLIDNKLSGQQNNSVFITKEDRNQKIQIDVIPFNPNYDLNSNQLNFYVIPDVEYLKSHSLFYNIDEQKLCFIPEKKKENVQSNQFMDLVPAVSILPHLNTFSKFAFNPIQPKILTVDEKSFVSDIQGKLGIKQSASDVEPNKQNENTGDNVKAEVIPWYVI